MKQGIPLLVVLAGLSACKTTDTADLSKIAPTAVAYESTLTVEDNLKVPSRITSETGLGIRATLQDFERAYEKNDAQLAVTVFAENFIRIEIGEGEIGRRLSLEDYRRSFGQKIDIALSHTKRDPATGHYLAVARLGHRSKWFSSAEVVTFVFDENEPRRIRAMIATPIYAETYPEEAVEIFVVDPISRNDLQAALDTKYPSEELDKILAGRRVEFPWQRNVTILFVFKEPPSPGSKISTEILMDAGFAKANGSYDYVVEGDAPCFVVANDGYLHAKSATIYIRAYVNDELVASKTMHR